MVLRCGCETTKKTKTKDATKAKKKSCARTLALLRKCCGGAIFLLHPLVATVTFRSLHCVQPDGGAMVVAARPRTLPEFEAFLAEQADRFPAQIGYAAASVVAAAGDVAVEVEARGGARNAR
jgi:hypothetical protein